MSLANSFSGLGLAQPEDKLTRAIHIDALREGLWLAGYSVDTSSSNWDEEVIDAIRTFAKDEGVAVTMAPVEAMFVNITPALLVDKLEVIRQEAKAGKSLYDLAAEVELAHRNAPEFKAEIEQRMADGTLDDWTYDLYQRWVIESDVVQEELKEIVDSDWGTFLDAAEALKVDPQTMRALLEERIVRVGEGPDQAKAVPVWIIVLTVVAVVGAVVLALPEIRKIISHFTRTAQLLAVLGAGAVGLIDRDQLPGIIEPIVNPPVPPEDQEAPSSFDKFLDVLKIGAVIAGGGVAVWALTKFAGKEK